MLTFYSCQMYRLDLMNTSDAGTTHIKGYVIRELKGNSNEDSIDADLLIDYQRIESCGFII